MLYAMLWYVMIWYDEWESMRLHAMIWDFNAMVWDSDAMLWYFNTMLCYDACCKGNVWTDCD